MKLLNKNYCFSWDLKRNHRKTNGFHEIVCESIGKPIVFIEFQLELLKSLWFSSHFSWNLWKANGFHWISHETNEKLMVFIKFHVKSLKTNSFFFAFIYKTNFNWNHWENQWFWSQISWSNWKTNGFHWNSIKTIRKQLFSECWA